MIKQFERADEANDAVELGPKTYNRMVETLERIAGLTVAPPLQISDSSHGSPPVISLGALPRPQPGLIVCYGPHGEADYNDQRYWVQFARCSNNDNDAKSNLNFVADGSGTIVTASDLFEFNAQSHNVSPGTPVILFSTSGQDGLKRWMFIAADETPSGQDCQGSGSGSDSSQCYCGAQYDYNCDTKTGSLTLLGVSCGNTFNVPADGAWHQTASDGTTCTFKFAQPTGYFCDPAGSGGECATADGGALCSPGAFNPGMPTPAQIDACCNPQNYCWEVWAAIWNCDTNAWDAKFPPYGQWIQTTCGNNTGMLPGQWHLQNPLPDASHDCTWLTIVATNRQCTDKCPADPVNNNPLLPPLPDPAGCQCGSGSGSGGAACFDYWEALILCGSGGTPSLADGYPAWDSSSCSADSKEQIGVWIRSQSKTSDPAGSCRYHLTAVSSTNFCNGHGACVPGTAPDQAPGIVVSDFDDCCTQQLCMVPCCPSDTSQNYVLMCIAGVMQWVPTSDGCPGSGS